jgi:hydrogenase-4 component B
MSQFFLSLLIIISGGLVSLVLAKQAKLSRGIAVLFIAAGSLVGAVDAVGKLVKSMTGSASYVYLDTFELAFKVDAISSFFLVVIFSISVLASIYSFHYMDGEGKEVKTAVSYFFFSLLVGSMALVVTASNMISFMLSWEIMSLSSYFLVIYNHDSAENRKAGYLYFIFSHVGAMFILSAFGISYGQIGTFDFSGLALLPDSTKLLVFILAFVGFGSKAGIFPFHVWLPHAHPAAPSHISALMSGVMIKTGVYGILRMYLMLDYPSQAIGVIVLLVGVVSGILGVVYALGQQDFKKLLAYSSVENIGIILIGMGIGMIGVAFGNSAMATLGFVGSMLHILNHALFKSLLFMGAGMILHKTGTRSIDALGGLFKNMRITGTAVLVGCVAICGLPPLNGFVGEFFIYLAGFKGVGLSKGAFVFSSIAIVGLAVIGGLALACFTRLFGIVFQGEPRSDAARDVNENGLTMHVSMIVLAIACAVIGIFPKMFIWMSLKVVSAMQLAVDQISLEPFAQMTTHISLGALILIAGLVIIWVIRSLYYKGKTVTASGTWGCGFTLPTAKMQYTSSSFSGSIIEFFNPVAPVTQTHKAISGRFPEKTSYRSHVNDIAEMHMETAVVRPVMFLFEKLRWIQHGDIHLYIGYILLAIILLLFFI